MYGSCADMSGTWAVFTGPSLDLSPLHFYRCGVFLSSGQTSPDWNICFATSYVSTFPRNQDIRFVEMLYEPLLPCSVLASNFLSVGLNIVDLTWGGHSKKLRDFIELADEGGTHWFPSTRTKPQGVDEIPLVKLKAMGLEELPWLTCLFFMWKLRTVPKEWLGQRVCANHRSIALLSLLGKVS